MDQANFKKEIMTNPPQTAKEMEGKSMEYPNSLNGLSEIRKACPGGKSISIESDFLGAVIYDIRAEFTALTTERDSLRAELAVAKAARLNAMGCLWVCESYARKINQRWEDPNAKPRVWATRARLEAREALKFLGANIDIEPAVALESRKGKPI